MNAVSILITTYNRAPLLKGAVESLLAQDFTDYDFVVMDDFSSDSTQDYLTDLAQREPRLTYIRAPENTGQISGDTPIVRKFLDQHCRASKCLHFNDDDELSSPTLLSQQMAAFRDHPSLAFVIGGVAQKYPHPIEHFAANASYIENVLIAPDTLFAKGVYPAGFIKGRDFLRLFAEDPPNRNIVCGAMMFDLTKVPLAKYFGEGFAGQAGPAMVCGAAQHGDAFFIDEPMLLNRVERDCMSFRGTQLGAFRESLASVDAAFSLVTMDHELAGIYKRMVKSYFKAYLSNKIAHRLGYFEHNPLGSMDAIMTPAITARQFTDILEARHITVTGENHVAIMLADGPPEQILAVGWPKIWSMCS